MAFIKISDVSFTYPHSSRPALDNLSLNIEKGEFVILFGPSGSGKSTLLRLLKNDIKPHGTETGSINFENNEINTIKNSHDIGFVFQDPENQVVAEEVLHELVFGLENIGLSTSEMRNRVAEMVHYMGAQELLERKTHELSGGQKQQLNLASVLLMQPSILLLDEPTAQLDPVSARDFLSMLIRLNEEFGITIVMAEHRLEEVISVADKIVLLDQGRLVQEGNPKKVVQHIWTTDKKEFVPSIPSLFLHINNNDELDVPLNIKEGRNWIESHIHMREKEVTSVDVDLSEEILRANHVFYTYDTERSPVIKDLNFTLYKGETYALLGGNGSGKSTFLKILCGIIKPQKGKVLLEKRKLKSIIRKEIVGDIGYLPQNPKLFFIRETVEEEIEYTVKQWDVTNKVEVTELLARLNILHLLREHPYDLSGGELQKVALACLLIRKPKILLLDEPTKGLDPISKQQLASILVELKRQGVTILITSHDIEFVAKHATRCGMMFQGKITSENTPSQFFKGNFFYTTMMQRLFRGERDDVLTIEEAVLLCEQRKD
ncbi:ABC transporter ATP-binding protein [Evansella cellulosilytica]|uniref:ABC transporter related protein n=1 Tax=Evansella cellulosilytica (strain ATCC 21833 / DSM 2522 / FERM P-1141 / JCM 9156 / N-4) TaxID=649639 RepID=E6TX20_EVAC2|nr:energy-coupling factor transporter ATPase [Evansella cellulosilytica]ADU31109.1 ABC transporter related protein [Evansella cellulosilytica DSM 2522]